MQTEKLTQSLKQEARDVGFELVGVCPAIAPPGYANFLQWLESGYAGQMHYLDNRKAAYQHPDGVMPGTKSVMMLGLNYRTRCHADSRPGTGRIARYAWGGVDYHDLIHGKLKHLKRFIANLDDSIAVRSVVDTAPLLEREFASLAGLGWQGKNTLLINKPAGSYFLLAAVLLSVPLEYDLAFHADHCGTCTACLDACPTDAFVAPNVLDATKCISYLTIEHRDPIPLALRSQMQDWLLGCDVCQDVCPWNRNTPRSQQVEFEPAEDFRLLDLHELFELSDDDFRQRFRKTPLWRPRRRGILRNAAIAMGNQPHPDNFAALVRGLHDTEPLVRGACVWSIKQHESVCTPTQRSRLQTLLKELLDGETDQSVRHELE